MVKSEAQCLVSVWLCLLSKVGMVAMMILVHAWMAEEIVGDIDLKEEILPMGLVSLDKGSRYSLIFLL